MPFLRVSSPGTAIQRTIWALAGGRWGSHAPLTEIPSVHRNSPSHPNHSTSAKHLVGQLSRSMKEWPSCTPPLYGINDVHSSSDKDKAHHWLLLTTEAESLRQSSPEQQVGTSVPLQVGEEKPTLLASTSLQKKSNPQGTNISKLEPPSLWHTGYLLVGNILCRGEHHHYIEPHGAEG